MPFDESNLLNTSECCHSCSIFPTQVQSVHEEAITLYLYGTGLGVQGKIVEIHGTQKGHLNLSEKNINQRIQQVLLQSLHIWK